MANKTPKKKIEQVKAYNSKLIYHRFQAPKDSPKGELLAKAKNDKQLIEKFWQFLEQEYSKQ